MSLAEFQAVVMALGRGSRMSDLTAQCAKPLLPVGGVPLLWYPLNLLERSGFKEAIVITGEGAKQKIKELVQSGKLKTSLDLILVDIPDEDYGTAESLRFVHDKIKSDILVISCDLILDTLLHPFVNLHRLHNSSLTMLFTPVQLKDAKAPGFKGCQMIERDFVAVDEEDDRLLFISSEADLDETLTIRKSLLMKHPNMLVHSQLMDAHLYLMKKWIVDYLVKYKSFSTLKGEVIPHLIKKQFHQQCAKNSKETPETNASVISLDTREDIYSYAKEDSLLQMVRELSSWNDHVGDMDSCYHGNTIRCYAYLDDGAFCIRANTVASYFEANKQILKRGGAYKSGDAEKRKILKAQADETSIVGAGTIVDAAASMKTSSVGPNCQIGEKVRLVNCVVMAGVKIENGSSVEGSILCANVTIGKDCKIKDSLVAAGQTILDNSKITREVVSDSTKMMEIV